jgi:DNA-directed RNA polymerase specialized sigma24 family protein
MAPAPVSDDPYDRAVSSTGATGDRFNPANIRTADEVVERIDLKHGQNLFGLARRAGLDDQTAEDAVQETLVRLWLEVRSGTDILDPPAWSFRTLARSVLRLLIKRDRQPPRLAGPPN